MPDSEQVPILMELTRASCEINKRIQLLFTPGQGRPEQAELGALEASLIASLKAELGVDGAYFGSCCPGESSLKSVSCFSIRLPLCTQPLAQTAQIFAALLKPTPLWQRQVGLSIEYLGDVGPRCAPDDAKCGPIPYWSPNLRKEMKEAGHTTPLYDPRRGRAGVDVAELGLAVGECKHDGDCIRLGCGNHCAAWQIMPFAAVCPAYLMLSNAHCGCLAGECAWFTQPK